jgi:hypothetical protein
MKKMIFVMIGLALISAARVYAYDDGDFQVWNSDVEEFKINKNAKIAFEQEFRWGNNASEFYYQHYDAGFFYDLQKWLNIGGGYRHIYELKKGKFKPENEPYVTATLSWGLEGFKFEDRSRMEYRHFDYQEDSWRYRNKITLKIFVGFGSINQFSQNRFSAGTAMSIAKNIKAEVYYMLQTTKGSGKWVDINVLGTKLKIVF